MIRQSGYRFSLATNAGGVRAEITLRQNDRGSPEQANHGSDPQGNVVLGYPAALAGLVAGGLTRRNRSTIRVPAWAGSRSTLASSLDAMAVTIRCPMPVERGLVLTLRPTPSSAIDNARSSPCAWRST